MVDLTPDLKHKKIRCHYTGFVLSITLLTLVSVMLKKTRTVTKVIHFNEEL